MTEPRTESEQPLYSTCEKGTNVIACGSPRGVYRRIESRRCPECNANHGFVERWDGAWYGTTLYGSCGDWWQDGWRSPRPFRRYWRRDAQERFARMWDTAAPADLYEEYVQADMALAIGDDWEAGAEKRDAAVRAIWAHQSALVSSPAKGGDDA